MTLDTSLAEFNANAFKKLQCDIGILESQVTVYQAQKKKIDRLAILALSTLAIYTLRLIWNRVTGTELKIAVASPSSIILGLFDLALGGGTLWYWIDKNNKTKQIADKIIYLTGVTRRNYYGHTVELRKDPVTTTEVLESLEQNLKPYLEDSAPIIRDYIVIATYQFKMEGDSADNFKISSTKIKDNWSEIEATLVLWRDYYSKLYMDKPESKTSVVMQAIATQCVQELPTIALVEGPSHYSCSSPTALNPRSGTISHRTGAAATKIYNYPYASGFREYLDNLPKVKMFAPLIVRE